MNVRSRAARFTQKTRPRAGNSPPRLPVDNLEGPLPNSTRCRKRDMFYGHRSCTELDRKNPPHPVPPRSGHISMVRGLVDRAPGWSFPVLRRRREKPRPTRQRRHSPFGPDLSQRSSTFRACFRRLKPLSSETNALVCPCAKSAHAINI